MILLTTKKYIKHPDNKSLLSGAETTMIIFIMN